MQTTALEAAANGVFITDDQGRIQWSNPAFSLLTGYSRESILGQTPRILKSGVQDQEYYSELRARQIAETLRSASLALTQTLNLPTVANTLLEYVAQLVPYQDASVVLFEGDKLSKVWAVHGYTQVADPVTALDAYFQPKSNPFIRTLMAQGHYPLVPDTSQQSDLAPFPA